MGDEYAFYDYIDADGDGTNVIKSWLNGDGKPAKAHFMMVIGHLKASLPPGFSGSFWIERYAKSMKGEWAGFIELRKTGSVQYRLIAQRQGRSVYLVACGVHKGQNFPTDISPQTALNRVTQMINSPAKYRREHEYN